MLMLEPAQCKQRWGRHLCQRRHRNQQGQPAVAMPLRRRCWPRDPSWQRAGVMTRRDHKKSPGALPAAGESRLGVPCFAAHAPASGLRALRKGWLPPSERLNTSSANPVWCPFPLPANLTTMRRAPVPHSNGPRCPARRGPIPRATRPHNRSDRFRNRHTPLAAYHVVSCGELLTAHPHMHSIKNRSLSTICRWAFPFG